jgi:hypothetical protein
MNLSYSSSYDKFHTNSAHIYRVLSFDKNYSKYSALTNYQIAAIAKANISEIISSTKVRKIKTNIRLGTTNFNENTLCVDFDFFELFDLSIVQGKIAQFGTDNSSILINEELSGKLFGSNQVVGKSIILSNGSIERPYTISGVYKNIPENSIFFGIPIITGFSIIEDKYISPAISKIDYSPHFEICLV